jgi:Icc-related predicted phosphoesterase
MTTIALGSDLHLEFRDLEFTNEGADVLVLAGDIMIAQDLYDHTTETIQASLNQGNKLGSHQKEAIKYRNFLERASVQFKHVIMIAGNHEFYHGRWYQALETMKLECNQFANIYFLEDQVKEIDGVLFIGTTLWTDMNKNDWYTKYQVKQGMSDFKIIKNDQNGYRNLHPDDVIVRHSKSLEFIKNTLANTSKKVVVVTHHAPSDLSVAECYKGDTLTNGAYRSNLEEFVMDSNIALWCCGHVHWRHMYYLNDTLVVCNPRGYAGHEPQADDFKLKYIDLSDMPPKFNGVFDQ